MTDVNSSDRDVTRAIRSWLSEDWHEDGSRLAGAVLDRVESTPQGRVTLWPARRTTMNKILGFGLAAAAVVAVLFGSQLFGAPTREVGTGVTPAPEPPVESRLLPGTDCSELEAGTYHALVGTLTVTVTVPTSVSTGWIGSADESAVWVGDRGPCWFGGGSKLVVSLVSHVYTDACNRQHTVETGTPAAVTAALAAQTGHQTTGPSDTSLGGYPASRFEFSVSDSFDDQTCTGAGLSGGVRLFPGNGVGSGEFNSGDRVTVWVVDVNGSAVAVATIPGDTDLDPVIDSLRIEP